MRFRLLLFTSIVLVFHRHPAGVQLACWVLRCVEQLVLLRTASVNPRRCGVILQLVTSTPCALTTWNSGASGAAGTWASCELFRAQTAVLEGLVKRHTRALLPCVGAFVANLRTLLPFSVVIGASEAVPIDAAAGCARSMSRLLEHFAALASASKHAPFVVVDFLALHERFTLRSVRRSNPGVESVVFAM